MSKKPRCAICLPLFAVLWIFVGGCADSVLLHPSRRAIRLPSTVHRTSFLHDGRKIEVIVARSPGALAPAEPRAYVLQFCGNASRAEDLAEFSANRWKQKPVEVWSINYPGFGGSDGPATLAALSGWGLAAYDDLAKSANGKPIFIDGSSLGSAVALFVARERHAAGMILQSPPPIRRVILANYGWWNLWLLAAPVSWQVPSQLDSLANGPHVRVPAVFILTGEDSIVPIRFQRMVADAYAGEKRIVVREHDGHTSMAGPLDEKRISDQLDWLWKKAAGS